MRSFPRQVQDRIFTKMDWYVEQDAPLRYAKKLSGRDDGRWRFRIGDYRVICNLMKECSRTLKVLNVNTEARHTDRHCEAPRVEG